MNFLARFMRASIQLKSYAVYTFYALLNMFTNMKSNEEALDAVVVICLSPISYETVKLCLSAMHSNHFWKQIRIQNRCFLLSEEHMLESIFNDIIIQNKASLVHTVYFPFVEDCKYLVKKKNIASTL